MRHLVITFFSNPDLAHDKTVEGFQCEKCDKKLSSETALEMHLETHEFLEAMVSKCKECGRTFKTERSLLLHVESAHKEEIILQVKTKILLFYTNFLFQKIFF